MFTLSYWVYPKIREIFIWVCDAPKHNYVLVVLLNNVRISSWRVTHQIYLRLDTNWTDMIPDRKISCSIKHPEIGKNLLLLIEASELIINASEWLGNLWELSLFRNVCILWAHWLKWSNWFDKCIQLHLYWIGCRFQNNCYVVVISDIAFG